MISDRYHTVGELVFPLVPDREISEAEIVCAIEESYDPRQGMSVLQVTIAGEQDTIVENLILNQTFMHNSSGCFEMTNSEWREDGVPPDLAMYEIMLGQVVFPVRQLLSIEDRFLVDGNNPTTFRGLPAIRYSYSIFTMNPDNNGNITIDIDAFWSDGSMNMSSKESQVPLGFIINRKVIDSDNPNGKEMVHHINLFVFLHSVVNKRMHWAREGEYCYGRKPVFPFPEVKTLTAFSYHTEITLPDFETILNTDGWMDTRNQIFRIDYDPVIQSQPQLKTRDFYSDIITINQGSGIAYRRLPDETCKILKIRSEDFDPQFIIDPRKKTSYNPTEFFGTRKTNFIDIGMVWKRGIPCRKFQGLRIDWPPDVNGITTLWEWCFLDNYLEWSKNTDGSFPVVSLEIYVTESPYNISSGVYYKGLRFWYNFYDMKKQSSVYLDNVAFDISSCFSANHKEFLEFQVSYDLQYFEELQDIIVNPMFQAEWKESITAAAQLKTSSLRITQVKSMIVGRDFFVQFTVLDRHPDLPDGIRKKEISMTDLINNLTQAVDLKEIGVDWPLADRNQNKVLKLRSVPNSLKTQFERGITTSTTSKPTTISSMVTETTTTNTPKKPSSPSSSSISTKEVVTTTVAPTKTTLETTVLITSSENPETTIELKKKKGGEKKLYSPGAMGGVAMAMLIIGIGLGVGGTFAKFKIFDNRDNSYKN
ncbi:uncharacterized protein LOC143255154 [Tachypleus tridentatus]|uniref:uncharacterized protein LOC143255154 n=1 Tax=Tachypleus tridentatus TaxID=6853 RepID=UPI003FD58EEC